MHVMHSGGEVSAALFMAFMLLNGAAGLIVIGLIVYFLATLHRMANALEAIVDALNESARPALTQSSPLPALDSMAPGVGAAAITAPAEASKGGSSEGDSSAGESAHV